MFRKDFNYYALEQDYMFMKSLLYRFQEHVIYLFQIHILSEVTKNKYIDELCDLSHTINEYYKDICVKLEKDVTIEDRDIISSVSNTKIAYDLIVDNDEHELIVTWEELHPLRVKFGGDFIQLSKYIGFPTLNDYMLLLNVKVNFKHNYSLFVPVILTDCDEFPENVELELSNIINDNMCILCYNVYIPFKHKIIGFFKFDYIGDINNLELIERRNSLIEMYSNNNLFVKYIENASYEEIMILSTEELESIMGEHYYLYLRTSKKTIQYIINTFVTNCDNKLFMLHRIIKSLLLGDKDAIYLGSLVFVYLRNSSDISKTVVDTIYAFLNFNLQKLIRIQEIEMARELVKLSEITTSIDDLQMQLLSVKFMPHDIRNHLVTKIHMIDKNNYDFQKELTYIKSLLNFPWIDRSEQFAINGNIPPATYIEYVRNKLNEETYGHQKAKERILLHIGELISNPLRLGYVMSFVGEPGLGKTSLVNSLAKCLNMPIITIRLGGQTDVDNLQGVNYTYASSQPGLLLKEIINKGTTRCILYLDELDKSNAKIGSSKNDIYSYISNLIDPAMNSRYTDNFFQNISFPLGQLIIIASYNTNSDFDKALLDRFDEIRFKSFNIDDKTNIARDFIIPQLQKDIKCKFNIVISDHAIIYIINTYTDEAGVRDLKRKLRIILMKINWKLLDNVISSKEIDTMYIDDTDEIDEYLDDEHKYIYSSKHTHKDYQYMSGFALILYTTNENKGGIIKAQIEKNYQLTPFQLKMTGSLSNETKESVECAYTNAIIYLKQHYSPQIGEDIENNYPNGFHIHLTDILSSKGGVSGCCAIAIAFISKISNKVIKTGSAVTGELDLNNCLLPVSDIFNKTFVAKQSGLRSIIIPHQNKKDIVDIINKYPTMFHDNFKYHLASTLHDVVQLMFET